MIKIHLGSLAIVTILLLALCGDLHVSEQTAATDSRLEKLKEMSSMRAAHTSTRLNDGRVLIAGGMRQNDEFHDSAELFDPKTGKFTVLPGRMKKKRVSHTATLLLDGRVLIVGGWSQGSAPESSAEIFDPSTADFLQVKEMKHRRGGHSATLLSNGKVIIAGGNSGRGILDSVEVFDPDTGVFTEIGKMNTARKIQTATLMKSGEILFTGGETPDSVVATAELFSPESGASEIVESKMSEPRYKHDAVELADGRVLIYGGADSRDFRGRLKLAEVFDPKTKAFERVGDLNQSRFKVSGSAVLLNDGRVLVTGGATQPEVFDPAKNSFALVKGDFEGAFYFMSATALNDGSALIIGGYQYGSDAGPLASRNAWIYRPEV